METSGARAARSWSDWTGFIFFVAYGTWLFWRGPELALLLLPTILQELAVGFSFLMRRQAKAASPKPVARISAYAASFIIPVFLGFGRATNASWMAMTPNVAIRIMAVCLWASGSLFSLWGVWQLRYAFSIEPQARELVTTGPYRVARHPIYLAYVLQYTGILLLHLSVPLALILVIWFGFVLTRIHFEEAILLRTFPAYATYREQVARFGVRLPLRAARRKLSVGSASDQRQARWTGNYELGETR